MSTVKQGPWAPTQRLDEFRVITPADWAGKAVPNQKWLVEGILPVGCVAMLSGDGGLGKSLLAQQLMTACCLGVDWLGFPTKQIRTFGMFCEDPQDELWRRQAGINRHYGCTMEDLTEDLALTCRLDRESYLCEFDRFTDAMRPTPLFAQLEHAVMNVGAQLVVLDTVRDTFGGNEMNHRQAARYIALLRSLAVKIQGSVIFNAHPSNEGMTSGSGLAGSRAWNNKVRSRLYLTKSDKEDSDQNCRQLKVMKSNYAPAGGRVAIRWQNGVFMRPDKPQAHWTEGKLSSDW